MFSFLFQQVKRDDMWIKICWKYFISFYRHVLIYTKYSDSERFVIWDSMQKCINNVKTHFKKSDNRINYVLFEKKDQDAVIKTLKIKVWFCLLSYWHIFAFIWISFIRHLKHFSGLRFTGKIRTYDQISSMQINHNLITYRNENSC